MFVAHKDDEYFPYDVTMFWEFFRWERYKIGHIYLQCFRNGKLYAGQSIQIIERMRKYMSGKGSNPHHTKAIKRHGWSNVKVLTIKCPWYMLDMIEKFLIEYYDLMDSKKGYNKQSGGRKNWHISKETRAKISERMLGEKHPNFGKKGPEHPTFGYKKTPEQIAKTSGENNGMFGNGHLTSGEHNGMFGNGHLISGEKHGMFGRTWTKTLEQIAKTSNEKHGMFGNGHLISGEKHGKSKPVCVFGKVYPAASTASNVLRAEHAPNNKHNFVNDWTRNKKHQPYTFRVTKEFYIHALLFDIKDITRDFYDTWLLLL
ncbi:GIY-YIG catalytic domain-containing endonuclease [Paramecium bursaria Chlorella virus NW665.2]|nr:GIY-YIG catalytic domain-containing endonuclease [Paramecium bursaria Chlorella virus NW665.2]